MHFTHYVIGHAHIGMYAFVTMVLFGSMYYILPRLTKWEWHSKPLIKVHFWLTALGIILYIVAMQTGGIWQGMQLNNPDIPFLDIVENMLPFLQARSFAAIMLTTGHLIFAWLVIKIVWHRTY
ncbi:MAG: cbb3-type cytochrome c oxidase subunit I [Fodinibius sp.]|nr:cbb3-type cytochrome c oxidase subunit I [Fodinibius sp.]